MSRRSSRLMSGGYYNSDEESDSSSVTNISYRENPVKVFKKKAGIRKAGSRTSDRASSNASSPSSQLPNTAGQSDSKEKSTTSSPTIKSQSPSASSSQTQPVMRTVPYVSTIATPRPALIPSSTRSQTPTCCPSVPSEKSPNSGLCSSSTAGLHLRPNHKELSQSGVDSSGYSSSEGTSRTPTVTTSGMSKMSSNSKAPSSGYRRRISSAFYSLTDTVSLMAAAAQSKAMHVIALANTSFGSHMKKACGLFLLLLIVLLGVWFVLLLLTSFISRMTVTKTPSQTNPESQPAIPASAPSQYGTLHPTPVVDPAVVSAVVEAKMQHLLMELRLKQEELLSQMKERMQLDMHDMKAKLEAMESDSQLHLQEVAGMGRKMADYQKEGHTTAAGLNIRIQALEAKNAKLSQELSSIKLMPPAVPCPETNAAPVLDHLTPELQQAMEKWFTDRIKAHDAIKLEYKGSCSDCGRPMADKMADFALETQGASVISTRCSETYRIRSACVTLFGFPLWYPSESPRTVIQGYPVLLPGKCWAFNGVEGILVISLSHPVRITHVTLDHLPRYNSPTGRIDSAPKDFEVYGMKNDTEEGTLLGTFTYDENGESTQMFELPNPSDEVYRIVELRVLSNWGHVEYTCLYRFRVHGKIAST